jgi:hypothetical protein
LGMRLHNHAWTFFFKYLYKSLKILTFSCETFVMFCEVHGKMMPSLYIEEKMKVSFTVEGT